MIRTYRFVLLEKERVGGLLWNANLVENYPGFPAGVSGPKLAQLIERQARRIGVPILQEQVLRVAILESKKSTSLRQFQFRGLHE